MLLRVPTGISDFFGTIAVSTDCPERRTNFIWLPFWLVSTKPADSSRRLTSRKGSGLRRPNLDLNHADLWQAGRLRRLKVQLQRLFKIRERLFFSRALTGNIEFQTLGDIPISLTPNCGGERPLHIHYYSRLCRAAIWKVRSLRLR